jgi:hypothetical protein
MATELQRMVEEPVPGPLSEDGRALAVVRRMLLAGFVTVLFLEAWLAWEFYRSLF